MGLLEKQVCNSGYQVSFYSWWLRPVPKLCKVPTYHDLGCKKTVDVLKRLYISASILQVYKKEKNFSAGIMQVYQQDFNNTNVA